MRIDLPNNMPHWQALERARGRKAVGRKHNHQPRGRAMEKRLSSPKRSQAMVNIQRKKFAAKVRAYFLGQLESYPERGE